MLHEVRKRHITQKQARVELGISVRWVRTLVKRLLREGDNALRHRLRGRPSNRETTFAIRWRVMVTVPWSYAMSRAKENNPKQRLRG